MTLRLAVIASCVAALSAAADPLSLATALELARRQGLDPALARSRLQQAEGAKRSELAALLPRLDVGVTAARNSGQATLDTVDATKGYTASPLTDPTLPAGSLSLTPNKVDTIELQPVLALSGIGQLTVPVLNAAAVAKTAAAGRRVEGNTLLVERAVRAVQIKAWQLMLAAKAARALVGIGAERLKVAKEQEQAAEARFKAGELDRLGLSRAKAATAGADRVLRQAGANALAARAAVVALLGCDEAFEIGEVPEPEALEAGANPESGVQQRLDIKAADAFVHGANDDVIAAGLRFAPTIDANAQFSFGNAQNFAGENTYWVVQGRLVWSLFDGGDRYGDLRRKRGLEAEATLSLEQAVREARRQFLVAREQVEASKAALASAQSEVKYAKESLEAARAQFRVGQLGYLELLDAQTTRFNAEEAQVNETLRLSTARLDLALAVGDEQRALASGAAAAR